MSQNCMQQKKRKKRLRMEVAETTIKDEKVFEETPLYLSENLAVSVRKK